ncbi:3-phosphoshikimate 1-carboxyvinyltransferase [Phycisphaerales bacterium]|nr:3-phosphoshikimate 1-carboxyvinyltransferase [Phycisphaerales bacterium]
MKPASSSTPDLDMLSRPLAELPDPLPLPTPRKTGAGFHCRAEFTPPGSKSLTNRAILLAALANGESLIRGALLDADDARVMLAAVRQLGAHAQHVGTTLRITGVGGRWLTPPHGLTLDLHNAGTATRFLAAAAVLSPAPLTIDGNARMRQRPIGELAGILAALGCGVEYLGAPGCPPVRISPPKGPLKPPAVLELGETQSSQFISALLLVAPWLGGITLRLSGEITSPTYITMTLGLLAQLGVTVRTSDDSRLIRVVSDPPGVAPFSYDIEPDASGATYWWGAGALMPGAAIRVVGLSEDSLQGDVRFADLLARMGCRVTRRPDPPSIEVAAPDRLRPILADMGEMPDAAMTLAAIACFAHGTSILRGLRTLRVKETDRIEALKAEISKLGVRVENPVQGDPDALTISPPARGLDNTHQEPVTFDTYDDHRMAMALSLIALRRPNILIKNPACVAKTYPTFWTEYARLHS